MRAFLDLPGASGSHYRFRFWDPSQPHLPIAGNFVFVRDGETGPEVLVVGATNDLSQARATFKDAQKAGAAHVYTRLNVARAVRTAEHEDLAGAYPKAKTVVSGG
jgi:hypothetical protein